jgi:hypothetical protein
MTDLLLSQARRLRDDNGWGSRRIASHLGISKDQAIRLLNKLKLGDAQKAAQVPAVVAEIEPRTAPEFAERISSCWRRSFEGIVETGRWLMRAKDALEHGEWTQMVEGLLPFTVNTAQRLMAVARDERITNPAHVQHLPNAWGTLYELTKLDDPTFQARIADGTIRPDMERRDVAKPINGARSVMASRQEPDDSLDYFPTPPWATRALCEVVLPRLGIGLDPDPARACFMECVWEPACGEGHMTAVLGEYFDRVIATDIHDYGQAAHAINFLDTTHKFDPDDFDFIITNPPFKDDLTEKFILRALDLARVGVAMFVRCQILEGIGRYERLWQPHPPTLIAYFSERVPLHRGRWEPDGSTATAYCWLVWVKDRAPMAPFWIPPGQRIALSRPDDRARFAAWSVGEKAEAAE